VHALRLGAAATALWLCCAATAHAQDEPPAHVHDGWMVRALVGPSGAWLHESTDETTASTSGETRVQHAKLSASGGALVFVLDVGHSLGPSWVLGVRLVQHVVPDPHLSIDGGPTDQSRTLVQLGPALGWFGPWGTHAAVGAGLALASHAGYDGDSSLGDAGAGFDVELGLDRWIADEWTLGGAMHLAWEATSGSGANVTRAQRALAIGLGLVLTYH